MSEELRNVEHVDESDGGFSNDDLFNITSWGADMSFRELLHMYDDDELLKPELQRKYVWDRPEASRFIESVLLGLPIPSIFLANTEDNNKLIIDGYQRIMTVYDYVVKGIFAKDGKVFKLTNTERINVRWRGKSYNELDEHDQKKIRQTTIHAIIFEQRQPKDNDSSLYQIFERINTSGKVLKAQEIRNCVYQGKLNSLLFELNANLLWRELFGVDEEDARMLDLEFILRYFALSSKEIIGRQSGVLSLKLYLNNYMGDKRHNTDTFIARKRNEFNSLIDIIESLFGHNAFRNITNDGTFSRKFHPTIFDSIMIATNYAMKKGVDVTAIPDLEERHFRLLQDENFKRFISVRTTNYENINGRINLATNILYGISYD